MRGRDDGLATIVIDNVKSAEFNSLEFNSLEFNSLEFNSLDAGVITIAMH